jgi:hypothetical protein
VSGAKSSGGVAREELDVEQTHEETQSNPKNPRQEAQANAPNELLQVDELVPSRGAGHRHQPDLTAINHRESGVRMKQDQTPDAWYLIPDLSSG